MQVYLANNHLHKLYEGKEFAERKYNCSTKEFVETIETLCSLTDVSACTSFKFLHYKSPQNGNNVHSVRVNAKTRLLFKQNEVNEITITGIQ